MLLNLELDTHPSWLAFSKETKHDLENIKLSDLPAEERATGIHATFELEKLLIEGHCRELPNGVPPRGLQLELLDRRGDKSDSLVMANMAYIQLHADSPGLYDLGIRPGRSSEVYSLTSLGLTGMDSEPVNVTGTKVAVTSFDGATIYPQFERNAGMEYADVLDTSQPPRSPSFLSVCVMLSHVALLSSHLIFYRPMTSRLGNFFGGARTNALSAPTKTQADINVFTVASGHLYEVSLPNLCPCIGFSFVCHSEDGNDNDGLGDETHGKLCEVLVHHELPQSCFQSSCFVLLPNHLFTKTEAYPAELFAPSGNTIRFPI